MKTYTHLWQYLAQLLLEWETFQVKLYRKSKHNLHSITFFSWKSYRLWDNVEKYIAWQTTDD